MEIFNSFGSLMGYVLWFFYFIFKNYGIAILVFTILVKLALLPLTLRQQRSQASTAAIQEKQKIIQEKYKGDRVKIQEEMQKIYAQEGTTPTSGCLLSLIPFPIMIGLYYCVMRPLSNALHINAGVIGKAITFVNTLPGSGTTFSGNFVEMDILRYFSSLKDIFVENNIFDLNQVNDIEALSSSFNFLGLDLLSVPVQSGFLTFLWVVPILSLLINIGTQVYMMFTNEAMRKQGIVMKGFMFIIPLITTYLAFTFPSAIGFYWICNGLTQFVQTLLINTFYSKDHMIALREAKRIARLEIDELEIAQIPESERKELLEYTETKPNKKSSNKKKK